MRGNCKGNIVSMEKLIEEIKEIISADELRKKSSYKSGESFNLISVMNLETDETRTHSRILADLLDPCGSHGQGTIFLDNFIELSPLLQDLELDTCNCHVYTEKSIGEIDKYYRKGGRIDIVIEEADKAIIIENKVNSPDQKNQLLRYHRYATQHYTGGFGIIYLNKFGTPASEFSTGRKLSKEDYIQIGYSPDILSWLSNCLDLVSEKSRLHDAIKQYKESIQHMTNQSMDDIAQKQLLDLLTKQENAPAIAQIILNEDVFFSTILEKYIWSPIRTWAESNNYEYLEDDEGCMVRPIMWKDHALYIGRDSKKSWSDMYIGVYHHTDSKAILKKDRFMLPCFDQNPDGVWPLGWKYLPDALRSWDFSTIENIVNGDVVKFYINSFEDVLKELANKELAL